MAATSTETGPENPNRELWYTIFGVGHPDLHKFQRFNMRLPSPPRCKLCYAPYRGVGRFVMKLQGRAPSSKNPRYCSRCDQFMRAFPGGAEVEMTIVFLDVRGSTGLGERMSPWAFSRGMQRFYAETFGVLYDTDGFIVDVRGDGLLAVYPPGFSGRDHARKALQAAEQLLGKPIVAADGTEFRFGTGVHTGVAYVGTMTGAEAGVEDVTVLGDAVNVAARLCAAAAPGEALVSDAACAAAGLTPGGLEHRDLELKGKSERVGAFVLKAGASLRLH
jgi:adenylate cyclase